jgi:hypothetical protein
MIKEPLREFLSLVLKEATKDDLEAIRLANNSYLSIVKLLTSLNGEVENFERVFKKQDGYFYSIALGAKLRRDEHTKVYVEFPDTTMANAPKDYGASAQMIGNSFVIKLYINAPPEVIDSPKKYNPWFAANIANLINTLKVRSRYVHEFVHTLDFKRMNKDYLYDRPSKENIVGTPEYSNSPVEMNAFYLQAISNLKTKLRKIEDPAKRSAMLGATPQEFADLFMTKYLNPVFREKLNAENQKRLRKRVASAWYFLKKD